MGTQERLLQDIESYLERVAISPTAFGELLGDRTLMTTLRYSDRDLKLSTVDKINELMALGGQEIQLLLADHRRREQNRKLRRQRKRRRGSHKQARERAAHIAA